MVNSLVKDYYHLQLHSTKDDLLKVFSSILEEEIFCLNYQRIHSLLQQLGIHVDKTTTSALVVIDCYLVKVKYYEKFLTTHITLMISIVDYLNSSIE